MIEAIAQQGEYRFIVAIDAHVDSPWGGLRQGHIVDIERGKVWDPMPIDSFLARGYWADVQDTAAAERAVRLVRERHAPPIGFLAT